jgi:hypothetical protein
LRPNRCNNFPICNGGEFRAEAPKGHQIINFGDYFALTGAPLALIVFGGGSCFERRVCNFLIGGFFAPRDFFRLSDFNTQRQFTLYNPTSGNHENQSFTAQMTNRGIL